ncbi:MAG: M15 family metallopeptidase [Parashewanella sp.]
MSNKLTIEHPHLYGLSGAHLVEHQGMLLEKETLQSFIKMAASAKQAGIELAICSAYRSFERQLLIWNNKASGKRSLLDKDSKPLAFDQLDNAQLVKAILTWSALPGASRHHWGTDLDVFDAASISKQKLQLIPQEYHPNGPCYQLANWLQQHAHEFGFFFPYQAGKSGVSPEPWHISYAPIAGEYLNLFKPEHLEFILAQHNILLKNEILTQLPYLVQNYVFNIADVVNNSNENNG